MEYKNGQNVFNKIGERLWEVYGEKNKLIGVAGLNQNPYSQYANVRRVRRFYVSAQFRRKGIGKQLLKEIIHYAGTIMTLSSYIQIWTKRSYFMNETALNAYTINIKSLMNIN
ncbi:GNAT family N-acetyltransferase [Priestia megaterium]|uniref:GNAT family N-acetyltransferase n=1 Tax=Priestia megaterium TaxID=1404 RepID=UPI002452BAEC|nr:GNAT family N-acetyltransferase [Priestia megaterium]MDH3186540.1 GNAT family N-acetyltransferase [Priestia megaterium]